MKLTPIKQFTLFVILFTLTACQSSNNSETEKLMVKKTLKETLDAAINKNVEGSQAGLIMLLVQNDEVIYEGTKGIADISIGQEITPETGFKRG